MKYVNFARFSAHLFALAAILLLSVNPARALPVATSIAVDASPSPSNYGAAVTFTAWIRPIVPNGETVTFYDGVDQADRAQWRNGDVL